jgi:RNA dependent RNA polymerase
VFELLLEKDLQNTLGVVNAYLDKPVLLRDWIAEIGNIYTFRCSGADYVDGQSGENSNQEPGCINYTPDGVPAMVHEVCVTMLEAGFSPKSNKRLRDSLKQVLKGACNRICDKMHISLAKSTSMMCIADDLGILEENEVSIRFGKPFRDEETGRYRYYIAGDVLVARASPSYCDC